MGNERRLRVEFAHAQVNAPPNAVPRAATEQAGGCPSVNYTDGAPSDRAQTGAANGRSAPCATGPIGSTAAVTIKGQAMQYYRELMELVGRCVDAFGVLIIVIGAAVATGHFVLRRMRDFNTAYRAYRQGLGRAILLGLEFLIAGDIIRTVVVAPTLENVLILALIVIIRTFLSMALQLEVEGRWPWHRGDEPGAAVG